MPPRKGVLQEKRCVILKGRHDGISIWLDSKADFDYIKDMLRTTVAGSRNFFDGASTAVSFKGRILSAVQEKALLDIIKAETDLDIAPIIYEDEAQPTKTSGGLIPAAPNWMLPSQSDTYYYQGSIRSGQTIRQNGSVVVIGHVNPGAEIKATGNIIVLGSLKGIAWAGAPVEGQKGLGNSGFFVSALDFQPSQVRIAHYITYVPEDSPYFGKGSWAYIQAGQVFITTL